MTRHLEYRDDFNEVGDYAHELNKCGLIKPGGICLLAGTEHCEFDCPARDALENEEGAS